MIVIPLHGNLPCRYAQKECDDCGLVQPANLMTRINRTTKSGHSTGISYLTGRRGQSGSWLGSYRSHYSNDLVLLCEACARSWRRRQRVKSLLLLSVIGAIAYGGYSIFMAPGKPNASLLSSAPATQSENDSYLDQIEEEEQELPDTSALSNADLTMPEGLTASQEADGEQAVETSLREEEEARGLARPTPDTSEALASSIREAAESGNPVRWKDGDIAGYAVPSEAQSGGTCRNVFYTVDSDGSGWQSEPQMICP